VGREREGERERERERGSGREGEREREGVSEVEPPAACPPACSADAEGLCPSAAAPVLTAHCGSLD